MKLTELIVSYNAKGLSYNPLEHEAIDVFTHDPKPEFATYVIDRRGGAQIGTIIATYRTDDPEGLARELCDSRYGSAIRYVEESGEMHALDASVGTTDAEDASDARDGTDTVQDGRY